ncbi:MAG: hypothetical protein AAF434_17415 [Pseudomonadota bacterium]
MFAGEVTSFRGDDEDPELEESVLFEVTSWGNDPYIELATQVGERRVYLKFRMFDLQREVKEQRGP